MEGRKVDYENHKTFNDDNYLLLSWILPTTFFYLIVLGDFLMFRRIQSHHWPFDIGNEILSLFRDFSIFSVFPFALYSCSEYSLCLCQALSEYAAIFVCIAKCICICILIFICNRRCSATEYSLCQAVSGYAAQCEQFDL